MSKETIMKLYAVRDKSTGKFVSDITNPRHKYWEKKGSCESAIKHYSPRCNKGTYNKEDLELVELTFVDNHKISEDREYVIVCNKHRGYWLGCLLFWGERTPDDEKRSFGGYTSNLNICERYTKSELENSHYNFPFYKSGDDWKKYENFAVRIDQFNELGLRQATVVYTP